MPPDTHQPSLYDRDFYAWTQAEAAKLRRAAEQRVNLDLDFEHLAEEVDDLGRSLRSALRSALACVIEHLLKLEHSPAADPRGGWEESVIEHRRRVVRALEDSPSLRPTLLSLLVEAWEDGSRKAAKGLRRDGIGPDALPVDCPYTLAEVLDEEWQPVNRHGLD